MRGVTRTRGGLRRAMGILLSSSILAAHPAAAWDFQNGDWSGGVRATVTAGTAVRTSDRKATLTPPGDGALLGFSASAPGGVNTDDGNMNYGKGDVVSTVTKAVVDVDLNHASGYGVFLRGKSWHDYTQMGQSVPLGNIPNGYDGGPLSDNGFPRGSRFSGVLLADAYVKGKTEVGGVPLTFRLGQQVIDWGPTFTIGSGLRDMNPRDYAAMSRPGALTDESWVPVVAAWLKADITPAATLEGFYQFLWRPSVTPGCGTFAATADYATQGCDKVFMTSSLSGPLQLATGRYGKRAEDIEARNGGQFGVGATYTIKELGSRIGAYYTNTHAHYPLAGSYKTLRTGTILIPGDPGTLNPRYVLEYPEDIHTASLALGTQIPQMGLKLAAEIDHKFNQPVQLNPVDLLAAFMAGSGMLAGDAAATAPGAHYRGYDRFRITQAQLAGSKEMGTTLGGTLTLGAETGFRYIHDLPDVNVRRYGRWDTFGQGPVNGTCPAGTSPKACTTDGFLTSFSWGYRLSANVAYTDVLPGLNLKPSIAFIHDVSGWSYDQVFNEGRKAVRLGLDGTYGERFFFNLAYQNTLAWTYDPRGDRDQAVLSVGMKL